MLTFAFSMSQWPEMPPTVGSTKPCISLWSEPGKTKVSESTHTMNSPRARNVATPQPWQRPRFFSKFTSTSPGWFVCASWMWTSESSEEPSLTHTTSSLSRG